MLTTSDLNNFATPESSIRKPFDHVVVKMRLIGTDNNSGGSVGPGDQLLLVRAVPETDVLK